MLKSVLLFCFNAAIKHTTFSRSALSPRAFSASEFLWGLIYSVFQFIEWTAEVQLFLAGNMFEMSSGTTNVGARKTCKVAYYMRHRRQPKISNNCPKWILMSRRSISRSCRMRHISHFTIPFAFTGCIKYDIHDDQVSRTIHQFSKALIQLAKWLLALVKDTVVLKFVVIPARWGDSSSFLP